MSMYPDYYYDYGYSDFGSAAVDSAFGVAGVLLGVLVAVWLIAMAVSVLVYIFHALGLYTVAKRRGIHNPWLAWIPVGVYWILGSISDQYQYVAKGQIRNRRKTLLGLAIAGCVLTVLYTVSGFIIGFGTAMGEEALTATIGGSALLVLAALATMVVSIVQLVFTYITYYDYFASTKPGDAVTFLVLGIFFNFLLPFFVFACRKHDGGMPPRRQPEPVAPMALEYGDAPVTEADFADPIE